MIGRYFLGAWLLFVVLHIFPTIWAVRHVHTYEDAMNAFRSYAQEIPEIKNDVYVLDEELRAKLKTKDKNGRELSRDLFVESSASGKGRLTDQAAHNIEVIHHLIKSPEAQKEPLPKEDQKESLTKKEKEKLEEYVEYLDAEQARFQEEYDTSDKKDAYSADFVDILLWTKQEGLEDVKDR